MSSRDYAAEHEKAEERGQTRRSSKAECASWVRMRRSRYAVSPISPAVAYKGECRLLMWPAETRWRMARGNQDKIWTTRRPSNTSRAAVGESSGCMLCRTVAVRESYLPRGALGHLSHSHTLVACSTPLPAVCARPAPAWCASFGRLPQELAR